MKTAVLAALLGASALAHPKLGKTHFGHTQMLEESENWMEKIVTFAYDNFLKDYRAVADYMGDAAKIVKSAEMQEKLG